MFNIFFYLPNTKKKECRYLHSFSEAYHSLNNTIKKAHTPYTECEHLPRLTLLC